jgi:hypothetical protein
MNSDRVTTLRLVRSKSLFLSPPVLAVMSKDEPFTQFQNVECVTESHTHRAAGRGFLMRLVGDLGRPAWAGPFSSHSCEIRREATNFLASSRYLSTEVNPQIQGGSDVRELTEAERQCLTETQSLTLDEASREALIGLTHEESCTLMAYRRRFTAGNIHRDQENLTIWLELAQRHELARAL